MLGFSRRLVSIWLVLCVAALADLSVTVSVFATPSDLDSSSTTAVPIISPQVAPPHPNSFPASHGIHFDRLTTEDGLSQNTVTSILQDSRGFMWFGTEDGLNKYDGHTFTVYRHDPDDPHSLRDDSIMTLYEDPDGVLWVGTLTGWLERHDQGSERFAHFSFDASILALYQDRQGVFWIATRSAIYIFDRDTEEPSVAFTDVPADTIYEDREGVLWFGSFDGWLHFLDRAANKLRPVSVSVPVENFPLTSITEDQEDDLWIGRDGGGVSRFDDPAQQWVHYRHEPGDPTSLVDDAVSSIYRDQAGALWIGTLGGGLDRFDSETGRFVHYQNVPGDPHSLGDNSILSLYQDRSGVLWIGTLTSGLSKLDLVGGNIHHFRSVTDDPDSLGDNVVLAIHQDGEGVLWIGTRSGLDRFDRSNGVWHHYRHDPDDPTSLSRGQVWAILEDSTGTLWIGTSDGLDRYDGEQGGPQKARFVHHPPTHQSSVFDDRSILTMLEGESGTLLAASSSVVYRFHPDSGRFDHVWAIEQSLSWDRTRRGYSWRPTILQDRAGALWLGTPEDGLYRFEREQWTHYQADPQDPGSLSSNSVLTIFEDSSGELWVGTGGGLDRIERETGTFAHYRVQDGLPSNEVRGILEDDIPPEQGGPYLWISSVGGLSRFDPTTETFRNYDTSDGLQDNEFNSGTAYKSSSGELFFGGMNGFNAFYPEQIADNAHVPPVLVTSLRLFNEVLRRDLALDEIIELSHRDNSLSFEFAALDYHAPDRNQYAYWMEGVDEDWLYAGTRRFAEYRDLNPGTYLFRVRGSNNTGVWSEQDARVHITIASPFWGTWWFRVLIGLVLVGAVIGAVRLRVRGIEARSRELEEQVNARTAELQREVEGRVRVETALRESEREKAIVAERNRIARELHDSVTQSLYAVTLYADAASRRLSSGKVEDASQDLEKLGRTAKDALGEMRLLIFELRPPILDEAGLSAALQARLENVEKRSGLKTEFRAEGAGQLPCEVEDGLYRVALEGLNNILKHARASRVTISLYHDAKSALLQLADDGVGFDPAATPNGGGMGLAGMAERVEQLGGRLVVDSEPGQGTEVSVEWREKE